MVLVAAVFEPEENSKLHVLPKTTGPQCVQTNIATVLQWHKLLERKRS